jgi:hypothetical protein
MPDHDRDILEYIAAQLDRLRMQGDATSSEPICGQRSVFDALLERPAAFAFTPCCRPPPAAPVFGGEGRGRFAGRARVGIFRFRPNS